MTQAKEVAKKESTAMAEFDPSMFEYIKVFSSDFAMLF